jgi:predicted NBD/HSP70 family sugar kinase
VNDGLAAGRPFGLASDPAAGHVLGVDLGGTKVRAAIAGPDGAVLAELEEPTARGPGEAVVAQVSRVMAVLRARAGVAPGTVRAAGLAVPVAIDPVSRRSWSTQNVPGFAGLDPAEAFERGLGLPVALDNDGNCAALGEGMAGAAVGVDDFVVLVIGTGIGSGIVSGGRLVRGAHGGGGEVAFLPVGTDPWDERNRVRGAFETAVAGPAVQARVDAALRAGVPTALSYGARLADVARAAADGDPLAGRLLDEEARLLALGIAAIAAVVDPELVVLSGGVGVVPGLLQPVQAHVAALSERPPRIVTGLLGDRAPLVGAIGFAMELAGPADDQAP